LVSSSERLTLSSIEDPAPGQEHATGQIRDTVYLGMMTRFIVRLESGEDLVVVRTNDKAREDAQGPATGDHVLVSWHEGDAVAMDDALI